MKNILRKLIFRLFGHDILYKPKKIKKTGIYKVIVPEDQPHNYTSWLYKELVNYYSNR